MARIKGLICRFFSLIKALFPVILTAVLCIAVLLAVYLNLHNIFIFTEEHGLFRDEVKIDQTENKYPTVSISQLEKDGRVVFDHSMMLINKDYLLSDTFEAKISEYKDTGVYMHVSVLEAYASLSREVTERFDKKLYVSSDFRTAEEQEALYREDPLTATVPGASEHQSGLALDVYVAYYAGDGFIQSPSGRFVNSDCHKYGFIIRYPSYGEEITGIRFEPWHIRYVGFPHASVIYNNMLTLEEYILSFEPGKWYEIEGYLVSRQSVSDSISLPEDFESCVISPDNTGYYFVTVKLS